MKPRIAAAALTAIALPFFAHAANQGSASTTSSSGSFVFTANGPAAPRTVQVLGLSDPTVTNASRSDRGLSTPGTTLPFCVVDNYGGRLHIVFSTANLGAGHDGYLYLRLKDADNNTVAYQTYLSESNGTDIPQTSYNYYQTPSGLTVTSTSSCGTGNIKLHLELAGTMPETIPARTYTDTITITVSPI